MKEVFYGAVIALALTACDDAGKYADKAKEAVEDVAKKLEETGVKEHCEGHIDMAACYVDQRCHWADGRCVAK